MDKIIILGGSGYTGRLLARHLLENTNMELTLAARRLDKIQAVKNDLESRFPGRPIHVVQADASSAASLQAALAGHTMLVVAAPTTAHTALVARTALDLGMDYLDVQIGEEKLAILRAMQPEILAAGRCFITEAGFHPGLPSALVRLAAAHLDILETAVTLGYLNMGKDLPYTDAVEELAEMFKHFSSSVFKDGAWTKPSDYSLRSFDFGGEIGRRRSYPMFFEELRSLPERFPSLRETGFYLSEMHWVLDYLISPLSMALLAVFPRAVRPIGKFFWWGMGTFHRAPYRVELQVQASGLKGGQPARMQAVVTHPDGYELTAIPVAAALLQYLDGSARQPGLWMMGHLVEPVRLMQDMAKMGVQVSVTPPG